MRHKFGFGIFFLMVSIFFLLISFTPKISGGVISVETRFSLPFIIGLVFFVLSFILFVQRQGLEYLVIPVGGEKWENPRARTARNTIRPDHIDRVVITGDIEGEKKKYKERNEDKLSVYDTVRTSGIKPGQIRILHGQDSEEDILYLGKIVKPGDTIYFDTFPLHYQEYKTLIGKAQRDGKFPKDVTLKNASIPQGKTEIAYGVMGWLEEALKRRPLKYKKDRESGALDKVKGIVKKVIGA